MSQEQRAHADSRVRIPRVSPAWFFGWFATISTCRREDSQNKGISGHVSRHRDTLHDLIESGGYALLGTGVWLIFLFFVGAYTRDGLRGLAAELNPFALGSYLKLLGLFPGLGLLFAARQLTRNQKARSEGQGFPP